MPVGASTKPFGLVVGDRMVVGSTTLVTQLSRHLQPGVTVASARTGDSVCHFVEENLVDVIVVG